MSEFPIQIDATSLFSSSFSVPRVTLGEVSSREVQALLLAPGIFQFLFGSGMVADFIFSVTPEGKVDYDENLDVLHPSGFLKGRGTSTLNIVGHPVTIDASQLTGGSVLFVGGGQITSSQTVTLVPAHFYRVQPGSGIVGTFNFQLTLDGKFAYDPTLDFSQGGFLKGQGSNTLTFLGYPAAVDATAVSSLLIIQGVFNFPDSHTGKADMVLMPANSYALQFKSGVVSDLRFNVELNGSISFDPTQSDSLTVTHEAGRPVLRVRPKNTRRAQPGIVNTTLRASSVLGRSLRVAGGDLLFFDRADEGDAGIVKRDLALLVGRDNFLQSMQVMIETPFGSDIFNVNYGFDLLGILSTLQTVGFIKSLIRLNIVKSLSQDNRVREITEVVFDDDPRFVEILPDQNVDENRRTRKVERRWQAVIVLQTISEGEVALRLEGTGLKT
jgi:hypothetical protein